jgi:Reverse transcriptase (RNA-dependent DNA polymerase)
VLHEYTKEITRAKDRTWQEFVRTSNEKTIWEVKKYLSGTRGQYIIPTMEGKAETFEDITNTLSKHFFPQPPPADLRDVYETKYYPDPVEYQAKITLEQIQRAVKRTNPKKAPGPDGITNKVLQQALPLIERRLQVTLQASLDLGYFPTAFKATTTVVIRKPQKPDYTKAKAYRPIALENTIGKIFESVISESISYLVETKQLLPSHHFGGRPGRSATDAMLVLVEEIHKAWKKQKIFTAVFLDVAGAFNNVVHQRLMHNLKCRKIPPILVRWIRSFLENRSTQLQFNGGKSKAINTPAGLPQGSPLSPILYMFYNSDLLEITNYTSDMAIGFIDDIAYGTAGDTAKENTQKLEQTLRKAEKWRARHGAQFEESKYMMVHFTRNKRQETKAKLQTVSAGKLKPMTEARYLGVTFDKELRFKAHIQSAIQKGTNAALELARVGKATWGAHYKYIRQLFQSTVASRLDYAAIIWHRPNAKEAKDQTAYMQKFGTVQRIGMKAILGCYRTTPTAAMEVETGLLPPYLRLQTKILKAATRIQELPLTHPAKRLKQKAESEVSKAQHRRRPQPRHCSPMENLVMQFKDFIPPGLRERETYKKPPWENTTTGTTKQEEEKTVNNSELNKTDRRPTKSQTHKAIEEIATKAWATRWHNKKESAQHLRRLAPDAINQGPKLYKKIRERSTCALLAQLRTGHCGLRHYLWRFKKEESAQCRSCGMQAETVEHFLLKCPAHWKQRKTMREKLGTGNMTMEVILGSGKQTEIVEKFAKATGRYKDGEWKEQGGDNQGEGL